MDRISAPFDVLDVIREPSKVALIGDPKAERIFRRDVRLDDLGVEFGETAFDLAAALLHLAVNLESLRHLILLGDFEAHDQLLAVRLAVQRVAGRVRPAMLQGLQHRGHLPSHIPGLATMNQSGNSTHDSLTSSGAAPSQGR